MANAQTSDVFSCTPEQFLKIVGDYEKYPEFLSEVKEVKVLKTEANRKLVEFTVSMFKSFKYTLWMKEDFAAGIISWEFASGDIFKTLTGSWQVKAEGDKVRATYAVETTFTVLVPGVIAKALVNVNLPTMMSSYHKRVQLLYGR